jgi:hypothetical protein
VVPANGSRDVREPTPDYDAASLLLTQPSDARRNSDPAVLPHEADKKAKRRFFGGATANDPRASDDDRGKKGQLKRCHIYVCLGI